MKIVRYFLLPLTLTVMSSIQLDAMKRLREAPETIHLKCCPLDESITVSDEPITVLPRIIKHSTVLSDYLQAHGSQASFYSISVAVPDQETLQNVVQCLRIIDYNEEKEIEDVLLAHLFDIRFNYPPQTSINLANAGEELKIQKLSDCIKAFPTYAKNRIYDIWTERLDSALKEAKTVFEKIKDKEHSAIIIDVDDTALSFTKKINNVNSNRPHYTALEKVRDLYKQVVDMGFKIFFLTGRTEKILQDDSTFFDNHESTVQNLKDEGYDIFEQVICVPYEIRLQMEEQSKGNNDLFVDLHAQWKESERNKIAERFIIAGTLDDMKENLQGENVGHPVLIPRFY